MKQTLFLILALVVQSFIYCQMGFVNVGTDISKGYKISYSIGQTFQDYFTNVQFSSTEGLQQVYPNFVNTNELFNNVIHNKTIVTKGDLNIDLSELKINSKFQVRIIDIKSQIIFINPLEDNYLQMDISSYSSGTYILTIYENSKIINIIKIFKI